MAQEHIKEKGVVINEITLGEDGEDLEIYVGGYFVCTVKKANLSKEAAFEIGYTEEI